jgi:hypothetical protein
VLFNHRKSISSTCTHKFWTEEATEILALNSVNEFVSMVTEVLKNSVAYFAQLAWRPQGRHEPDPCQQRLLLGVSGTGGIDGVKDIHHGTIYLSHKTTLHRVGDAAVVP